MSMICGNLVLLERVIAIVRPKRKKLVRIVQVALTVLRLVVGIWDTISVYANELPNGFCIYVDKSEVGASYTSVDTLVDLIVAVSISVILVRHMMRLNEEGMATKTNIRSYVAVTVYNGFRTGILTVVNLLAAIVIATNDQSLPLVRVLWPLTNYIFLLLVGYDTDLTKALRDLPKPTSFRRRDPPPIPNPA
ncbi:hypothetical protein DM01DRAFT_1349168 [Hesseltinella vesiculosa]|uniref:Uncharacterized protein n=1 Tax=Hesseltinella vesiculosa TaxID=101127 RepID=A0A1X2G694_9FUNG|nr:hypothetical protein DM01DRAFT_1349168 [Hesseltinella vesiculosa]